MQEPDRLRVLNDVEPDPQGSYVLYWMQASQRTRFNHALERAIELANERDEPVVVCFGLTDDYPEANERHYAFMLEGLRDVEQNLAKRNIKFVCDQASPANVAIHYAKNASVLVGDFGYVRPCRRWVNEVADAVTCRYEQVESGIVVPVETASDKREYAARTIRSKLHKQWDHFLGDVRAGTPMQSSLRLDLKGTLDLSDPAKLLKQLKIDRDVPKSRHFEGGENEAAKLFESFLEEKISDYAQGRNEPSADRHSYMSMYLHFGQISPIDLVRQVKDRVPDNDNRQSFIEELVVRRELAKNFVWYSPSDYDSYATLPDWAKKTLAEHRDDKRPTTYTRSNLEQAKTDDPYWNAAMDQMRLTGFMHNYMRMYWGKKVLEWTNTPEYGYETLLYLNNKYFIDGRDPNSYSNVAWVFGLHDRPWTERNVFGKIRYMNAKGLERKFDIKAYVRQIDRLRDEAGV
jgi:deoxyribodipyrimidine photo-lyase